MLLAQPVRELFFYIYNSSHLLRTAAVTTEGSSIAEASLLPQEALDNIAGVATSDSIPHPSLQALQSHQADLEQEVRDIDFRLHFMYRQRLATLELLNTAKDRVDKLAA